MGLGLVASMTSWRIDVSARAFRRRGPDPRLRRQPVHQFAAFGGWGAATCEDEEASAPRPKTSIGRGRRAAALRVQRRAGLPRWGRLP